MLSPYARGCPTGQRENGLPAADPDPPPLGLLEWLCAEDVPWAAFVAAARAAARSSALSCCLKRRDERVDAGFLRFQIPRDCRHFVALGGQPVVDRLLLCALGVEGPEA